MVREFKDFCHAKVREYSTLCFVTLRDTDTFGKKFSFIISTRDCLILNKGAHCKNW